MTASRARGTRCLRAIGAPRDFPPAATRLAPALRLLPLFALLRVRHTATMSKLSNSILSLKFMQNAQRAKQQKEVEIERAKVKDEAEWEVPKEVREGWGPTSSSSCV